MRRKEDDDISYHIIFTDRYHSLILWYHSPKVGTKVFLRDFRSANSSAKFLYDTSYHFETMKVGIHVWVNEEDWAKFKKFCLNKHKKLHRVLGEELSLAIRHYLECVAPSLSSAALVPSAHGERMGDVLAVPDTQRAVDEEVAKVVEVLARYCEPGAQMAYNVLALRIGEATGRYSDNHVNRVIRKLYAHGVIEPDHSSTKGRVFIVKDLSLWSGGPHGRSDPLGRLRG